jgi:hypothetical protein
MVRRDTRGAEVRSWYMSAYFVNARVRLRSECSVAVIFPVEITQLNFVNRKRSGVYGTVVVVYSLEVIVPIF